MLGARKNGREQARQAQREVADPVAEHGARRSAVHDEYRTAQAELSRHQVEVEEIKRGIRDAAPPEKTFGDLCDYWLDKRAPRKTRRINAYHASTRRSPPSPRRARPVRARDFGYIVVKRG